MDSISGLGISPGEGKRWATVHGVAKELDMTWRLNNSLCSQWEDRSYKNKDS